jgi:formylglycine-generating enzyme required for sulfatase activity
MLLLFVAVGMVGCGDSNADQGKDSVGGTGDGSGGRISSGHGSGGLPIGGGGGSSAASDAADATEGPHPTSDATADANAGEEREENGTNGAEAGAEAAASRVDAGNAGGDAGTARCPPGMVPIAARDKSFMMGLNASEAPLQSNGMPWACYLGKHQVTFTYDYCMDANLVTQAEFSARMGFNPSRHTGNGRLPVDSETWYDAVLYCNAKSATDGRAQAYSHGAVTLTGMSASNIAGLTVDIKKNGYRLPTNAEYEYAERADTTGLYFFSATASANVTALGAVYAWYSVNSTGVSQPVGMLKPNPWGLYDIVGNLFEWEYDWEGPYVTTPEVDPLGPATGTGCGGFDIGVQRMAKGGSWHTDVATHMRIGYHYKWRPASVHPELGFRCVATVSATN